MTENQPIYPDLTSVEEFRRLSKERGYGHFTYANGRLAGVVFVSSNEIDFNPLKNDSLRKKVFDEVGPSNNDIKALLHSYPVSVSLDSKGEVINPE